MIEIEEKEEFVQTVEKPLSLSKRGLGRSPKAGRRDARVDYNIKCNTKNMDIILTFV